MLRKKYAAGNTMRRKSYLEGYTNQAPPPVSDLQGYRLTGGRGRIALGSGYRPCPPGESDAAQWRGTRLSPWGRLRRIRGLHTDRGHLGKRERYTDDPSSVS